MTKKELCVKMGLSEIRTNKKMLLGNIGAIGFIQISVETKKPQSP